MTPLRLLWLGLALIGAVLPMWHFASWSLGGNSVWDLWTAWGVNDATRGLRMDLAISAIALCLWATIEALGRKNMLYFIVLPITVLIGTSCALPFFLYLRETYRFPVGAEGEEAASLEAAE